MAYQQEVSVSEVNTHEGLTVFKSNTGSWFYSRDKDIEVGQRLMLEVESKNGRWWVLNKQPIHIKTLDEQYKEFNNRVRKYRKENYGPRI